MSTRWAKCSAPDSVGRQANSRTALPSFFCFSVGLLSIPPCCPAAPAFGALTRPGQTSLRPFRNHAVASAVRSLGSRSSNFPSSFSKQSLPLRGLCFFLVLPCGFVQMHRGSSSRSLRSISLFSRLPTCVARLPAVQRDVSQKSRVIIPKNVEQSGKTRRLFPDYSAVSRLFLRRRAAYPRCILNLCEEGKHRVPILCINFAAFTLFPSAGKLSGSTFRLHPYSFHRPFYNKTHSPRSLSQLSQNPRPKIPTCSDCPRTILYLISHFKNFSL